MQDPKVFWFSIFAAVLLLLVVILSASSASTLRKLQSTPPPTSEEVKRAEQAAVWASVLSGVGLLAVLVIVWIAFVGTREAKGRWSAGVSSAAERLRFSGY